MTCAIAKNAQLRSRVTLGRAKFGYKKNVVGYSQAGYSQRLFTVWAWPVSATGSIWRKMGNESPVGR